MKKRMKDLSNGLKLTIAVAWIAFVLSLIPALESLIEQLIIYIT